MQACKSQTTQGVGRKKAKLNADIRNSDDKDDDEQQRYALENSLYFLIICQSITFMTHDGGWPYSD